MKVLYEKSFLKDVNKIKGQKTLDAISELIDLIKRVNNVDQIPSLKKLKGHQSAYRIRIGKYRLGFFLENDRVIFSRVLHRKNIYRIFP